MTWKSIRLRRLIESAVGGVWGEEAGADDIDVKCVRAADFDYPHLTVHPDNLPTRSISRNDLRTRQLHKGDLVLEKSGGGELQPVGRVVRWDLDEMAVSSNFAARIRPAPGISDKFLAYLMASLYSSGATTKSIKQTTGIQNLDLANHLDERVVVPGEAQQRAIAAFLDTETARIDGLIVKKRQMRRLLDTRFAAYRAHLMLNGIDPTSTDASHAGVAKLGVAVTLQRGHDLPADARKDGIVPVISSGGFSGTHAIAAVEGPGVVTGRYGTIGKSFYVESDYWPLNTTLYIKDFRGCWPKWVYHLLASLPLDIDSAKSAVTGIDRNVIGGLRIRVRSVADQREISIQLDQEETRTCRISEMIDGQIALLQEHRQALITAAVTGEMDVPGVRR